MADEYIKREDAVELSNDIIRMVEDLRACDAIDYNAYSELFDMLCGFDTIPAADVREVVLCKDCTKSNYDKDFWKRWCCRLLSPFEVTDDFFCADGKRRETMKIEHTCETCIYNPPSACDGKPCCACDTRYAKTDCWEENDED